MNQLTVSVIMPVYNAEHFLKEAIESILNQTFLDYQFIIINDGSSDSTEKIVNSFKDSRIQYVKNSKNRGLSATLNRGLRMAKGKYIARMDADDISFSNRLQKQVDFLNNNADYGVVGSMYLIIDEKRKPYEIGGMDYRSDQEIKIALMSNNVFLHGEIMFRKELIESFNQPYDTRYNPCEDYELWIRISQKTKFYILEDILYKYMINPNSMSGTRWLEMKQMIRKIGRELQSSQGLPAISRSHFSYFYNEGLKKHDGKQIFENHKVEIFNQLNYQEFLFRTGLVYLKHVRIESVGFLVISFLINPYNWLRKFYRLIFLKHPRLKKRSN